MRSSSSRAASRWQQPRVILVDTKYEFGTDENGKIILADEIHTPDSSRYWIAESYPARFEAGERPESFDKDFVRAWSMTLRSLQGRHPEIPAELIRETSAVYMKAFEAITGKAFDPSTVEAPVLDRVRKNLAPYFTR